MIYLLSKVEGYGLVGNFYIGNFYNNFFELIVVLVGELFYYS